MTLTNDTNQNPATTEIASSKPEMPMSWIFAMDNIAGIIVAR